MTETFKDTARRDVKAERPYRVTRSGQVVVNVDKLVRSDQFRKTQEWAREVVARERERRKKEEKAGATE